jgi:hypothetical protein
MTAKELIDKFGDNKQAILAFIHYLENLDTTGSILEEPPSGDTIIRQAICELKSLL